VMQDGNYFLYGGYHQEGKILGQNEVAPRQNFRTPGLYIYNIISFHTLSNLFSPSFFFDFCLLITQSFSLFLQVWSAARG